MVDDLAADDHAAEQFGAQTLVDEALAGVELAIGGFAVEQQGHVRQAVAAHIVGEGAEEARQVALVIGLELQLYALKWRHKRHSWELPTRPG
ncbi:hypothetical protein D3C87_2003780 [compost metagenome]